VAYLILGFRGLGGGEGGKKQVGSGDIMFKFNFNVRINLHFYRCVYCCLETECNYRHSHAVGYYHWFVFSKKRKKKV